MERRNFDDGVPQCRWDRQERHVGGSRDDDRGSWANQVLNHRLQRWKNRRSNPHRFRIQIPTKTLLLESGSSLGNCGGEPRRVVAQKPVLNRRNHDLLNARSGAEIHFSNPSTQNIATVGGLNACPLQRADTTQLFSATKFHAIASFTIVRGGLQTRPGM